MCPVFHVLAIPTTTKPSAFSHGQMKRPVNYLLSLFVPEPPGKKGLDPDADAAGRAATVQ